MDIRERIVGRLAYFASTEEVAVNFGDLVSKLVLSEHFVLDSIGLAEFPLLVRKFGYDGVLEWLDSGLVDVQCELNALGSVQEDLPPGAYCLASFTTPDIVSNSLKRRLGVIPSLSERQARTLRKKVTGRVLDRPDHAGRAMIRQLHVDLRASSPMFKAAIAQIAEHRLRRPVTPGDFSFSAFPLELDRTGSGFANFQAIQTDTDLGKKLDLDDRTTGEIVFSGLNCVAELNKKFEQMERFNAVTEFSPLDMPLFEQKLKYLADQMNPGAQTGRFARVIALAELPAAAPSPDIRDVNLGRLVEIAQSDEAREFRGWLRGIDAKSDREIRSEIG